MTLKLAQMSNQNTVTKIARFINTTHIVIGYTSHKPVIKLLTTTALCYNEAASVYYTDSAPGSCILGRS